MFIEPARMFTFGLEGHSLHMQHLTEVMKIIEGAVNADRKKVVAYTELLAKKLMEEGNPQGAKSLLKILSNAKMAEISPSRLGTLPQIPVDGEGGVSLGDQELFRPDDIHVFLSPSAQEKVDEFLRFIRGADRLLNAGMGISPSLLLHGPPGCGKTELGKKIAADLGLPLITARTDGLISSYLGRTAKNLRLLFEHAMGRPCVLFLDEFDALAKLRDDQHELGELKRVVVSLLQNIDALDNRTVLVAATNHSHLLDPAIWRRFAFKVSIEAPEPPAREAMLRHFLQDFSSPKDVALLTRATDTLTGSEINQICQDAKREAVLSDSRSVKLTDLLTRVLKVRLRTSSNETVALPQRLREARQLDPKVFTYRRLAEMFGYSLGHVSNLLARDEVK